MIRIILIILTMNCYYYTILFMSNTTQDGGTKGRAVVWTDAVPKGSELRALVAEPFQVTPHSKITGMWLVSLPSGGTQSVFSSQIKDAPTA